MSASEIAAMAESEQPHGHLVTQILGTKRELEVSKEEIVPEDQVRINDFFLRHNDKLTIGRTVARKGRC